MIINGFKHYWLGDGKFPCDNCKKEIYEEFENPEKTILKKPHLCINCECLRYAFDTINA